MRGKRDVRGLGGESETGAFFEKKPGAQNKFLHKGGGGSNWEDGEGESSHSSPSDIGKKEDQQQGGYKGGQEIGEEVKKTMIRQD